MAFQSIERFETRVRSSEGGAVPRGGDQHVARLQNCQYPRHNGRGFPVPGCCHVVPKLGQVDTVSSLPGFAWRH